MHKKTQSLTNSQDKTGSFQDPSRTHQLVNLARFRSVDWSIVSTGTTLH